MLKALNFKKGVPHTSSRLYWFFNLPSIQNEAAFTEFIEKTINAQLPDHLNDQELFEIVKTYQVHGHSRTSWKYNKNECCFPYGWCFTEKTIIGKWLNSQKVSTWRNTLLRQFKSYIDNNFNPVKVSVIDLTKRQSIQPLNIGRIRDELNVSKDDITELLSISKDLYLELHLKREPNSRFVNNYFDVGLKAWQAAMDL